jgi:hypothetical protein
MGLWSTPITWTDGEAVGSYLLNRYLRDNLRHLHDDAHPQRADLWHEASIVTAGNAIVLAANTSAYFNYVARQTPPAQNDAFTQSAVLLEGAYRLIFGCVFANDSGILDCYLNGDWIASQDFYAAVSIYSLEHPSDFPSFQVPYTGRHVFSFVSSRKHASSSDYYIRLSRIGLVPVDGDL